MTHPMIPRTHYTRLAIDEWTADHYPPAPPLLSRLTDDEALEAARLLAELPSLVGTVPAEVVVYLTDSLVLRDRRLLTWLRSLDEEARG